MFGPESKTTIPQVHDGRPRRDAGLGSYELREEGMEIRFDELEDPFLRICDGPRQIAPDLHFLNRHTKKDGIVIVPEREHALDTFESEQTAAGEAFVAYYRRMELAKFVPSVSGRRQDARESSQRASVYVA